MGTKHVNVWQPKKRKQNILYIVIISKLHISLFNGIYKLPIKYYFLTKITIFSCNIGKPFKYRVFYMKVLTINSLRVLFAITFFFYFTFNYFKCVK